MEIFSNQYFEFHYPISLQPIIDKVCKSVNYKNILQFFGLEKFRLVRVNLFENKNNFFMFLKSIQNQNEVIPSYCRATFDKGMINILVENLNEENLMKNVCTIFHELVHIINKEKFYDKRVLWFDEGLAQNLSGEMSGITSKQIKIIVDNLSDLNQFSLSSLEHGDSFVNEKYNGYEICYLCVRYLIDTMDHKEFLKLLKSSKSQELVGKELLSKVIIFYNNQYNL